MAKEVFFTRGRHAIGIERHGGTIRMYTGEPPRAGDKPIADGVATFERWSESTCAIKAAQGAMDMQHIQLIALAMHETGFLWLVSERTHGKLPLFKKIETGPLAGWFECDLNAAVARFRRRNPVPPRRIAAP